MLISDEQALKRLNSSDNLMNRLKATKTKSNPMNLFTSQSAVSAPQVLTPEIVPPWNPFKPQPSVAISVTTEGNKTEIEVTRPEPPAPSADQLLDDVDKNIRLGLAHDNALTLMTDAIKTLSTKLDDIKPEKLPAVVATASKVVETIRKEKLEKAKAKINKEETVHIHLYGPKEQRTEESYETVTV